MLSYNINDFNIKTAMNEKKSFLINEIYKLLSHDTYSYEYYEELQLIHKKIFHQKNPNVRYQSIYDIDKLVDDISEWGVIFQVTEIGGASGGNCYGDEAHSYHLTNGNSSPFIFDDLLTYIAPQLTFVQYRDMMNNLKMIDGTDSKYEYYGNHTEYHYKYILLENLCSFMEENGLLPNSIELESSFLSLQEKKTLKEQEKKNIKKKN